MAENTSTIRETDEEARRLGRRLVRSASFGSLAVCDAQSGFPAVSRALVATDFDGVPVILVSSLAAHTQSIVADPRCSLLAGEPGKGDPLAHPRITVFSRAEKVDRQDAAHGRIRRRFLNRHPKSALYIDFADFCFFRLTPLYASLNGGFGRAYTLDARDIVSPVDVTAPDWLTFEEEMMGRYQDVTILAEALGLPITSACKITGIDPAGIDLSCGSVSFRHDFAAEHATPQSADEELKQRLYTVQPLRKI